jgi:hypothetical protein
MRDKREDEAVADIRIGPGLSGPINWPKFDPEQRPYGARSFAQWSLSGSCGPLQAGKASLLPAFNPRNYYFTTPYEADTPLE